MHRRERLPRRAPGRRRLHGHAGRAPRRPADRPGHRARRAGGADGRRPPAPPAPGPGRRRGRARRPRRPGRRLPARSGHFFAPMVLADVPDDARTLREEIFGPIAPVRPFDREAEVLARANACDQGLAAYLHTATSTARCGWETAWRSGWSPSTAAESPRWPRRSGREAVRLRPGRGGRRARRLPRHPVPDGRPRDVASTAPRPARDAVRDAGRRESREGGVVSDPTKETPDMSTTAPRGADRRRGPRRAGLRGPDRQPRARQHAPRRAPRPLRGPRRGRPQHQRRARRPRRGRRALRPRVARAAGRGRRAERRRPHGRAAERRYSVPAEHREPLLDRDSPNYVGAMPQLTVGVFAPIEQMVEAFRTGEGVPYAEYGVHARRASRPSTGRCSSTSWPSRGSPRSPRSTPA